MKKEIITITKLISDDGMILTNGEIYGKEIFLAEELNESDFYEITEDEYENTILQKDIEVVS